MIPQQATRNKKQYFYQREMYIMKKDLLLFKSKTLLLPILILIGWMAIQAQTILPSSYFSGNVLFTSHSQIFTDDTSVDNLEISTAVTSLRAKKVELLFITSKKY